MAALAAVALLMAPSGASGAITIGADISAPTSGNNSCSMISSERCTYIQADPIALFTSPIDGVIVRWRVRGDSNNVQYALRTARPVGALFEGGGTSAPQTVGPGLPNVFETSMPIRQGEVIGIDVPGGSPTPTVAYTGSTMTLQQDLWDPPLAQGEIRASNGGGFGVMLVNADIEPDCDADGFGDETQDSLLFGGTCPALGRTLTLETNKAKVKKGKKVTFSGQVTATGDESACKAGQSVELQRKKASQTEFKTFAGVQSAPTGAFSLEQKVKKTLEYRAVIGAAGGCGDATSNTEKVKAKKPK